MTYLIRRARDTDADFLTRSIGELQSLHAMAMPDLFKPTAEPYLPERLSTLLSNSAAHIFIAEVDDCPVGFAHFWVFNEPEGENNFPSTKLFISYVYVRAEIRSKGVGRALVDKANTVAKALGISSIELNVMAFNHVAKGFFERCGFTTLREVLYRKV